MKLYGGIPTGMFRDGRNHGAETIAGERRSDRRYQLQLEIRWRLLHRRRVLDSGSGRTVDLSSHGILFEAGRMLPPGSHLEVSVSWPALLHGVSPLKLIAAGPVVRSDDSCTAIRMVQHEFRTVGVLRDQNAAQDGSTDSIPVWNISRSLDAVKLQ